MPSPNSTAMYEKIPKDLPGNLKWRRAALEFGNESKESAQELWTLCSRDPLFFVNGFLWLEEPRSGLPEPVPFITYPFQDRLIRGVNDAIPNEDCIIEKSREQGATWCMLALALWRWQFHAGNRILLATKDEALCDSTNDSDSLFFKLDQLLSMQPKWLKPVIRKEYERTKLNLFNPDNGSTIDGSATHAQLGRGGRRTWIILDEFAFFNEKEGGMDAAVMRSTRSVTNSRTFISTHNGAGTEFYRTVEKCKQGKFNARHFFLHWKDHPTCGKDQYMGEDGKLTSPWREAVKLRCSSPIELAQEVDVDVCGSSYQFFDYPVIITEPLRKKHAQPPIKKGFLRHDPDTAEPIEFVEHKDGNLELYEPLVKGKPIDGEYAMGTDVSQGTGASNSVTSVFDKATGWQVAEMVDSKIPPPEWAVATAALGKWFYNAYAVWENNGGVGKSFTDKFVDEVRYMNIYMREKEEKITKDVTLSPGWYSSDKSKYDLLLGLKSAMISEAAKIRSEEVYKDCVNYQHHNGSKKIEHVAVSTNPDPSGAGANHGDRAIAAALAILGIKKQPATREKATQEKVLDKNSFGARQQARLRAANKKEDFEFA